MALQRLAVLHRSPTSRPTLMILFGSLLIISIGPGFYVVEKAMTALTLADCYGNKKPLLKA